MTSGTFGTNGATSTNASRPSNNSGNMSTSDNRSNGHALTSSLSARRGGWGSNTIWGSGSLSNGLDSRDGTRDNSRSRGSRPSSSDEEVIEGKTGSGSLVDSSVSDDPSRRDPWGAKRSVPSGRSMSRAQYSEASNLQPRSVSNAGLAASFNGINPNSTPLASRAPTVAFNATSTMPARNGLNSPYSFGFSGRGSEQPPNVYTKFDRHQDPSAKKQPDSAKGGPWAECSPTDERKPSFNGAFGNRTSSSSTSRDHSGPNSRCGAEFPLFTRPDYSRTSQQLTQTSSRAPSISSPNDAALNEFMGANAEQLSWQLNQLNLNTSNLPLTSRRGSIGSVSTFNQLSSNSAASPFSRVAISGNGLGPKEATDRVAMNYFSNEQYFIPQQAASNAEPISNGLGSPGPQTLTASEPGRSQPYLNGTIVSHLPAMAPNQRSNGGWTPSADIRVPANRRLPDIQHQSSYMEFRVQPQMLAPQLGNPLQPIYSPYAIHQALQLNGANTFVPLVPMNMSPIEPNDEIHDMIPRLGESMQSMLMYEFKSNSKSRRYELKDIYGHIPEFSGDQHGSRFIQTKLESANSDEKERVFREIEPNALQLMTDVFGNYVIQKFFEHGDQRHKKILANKMKGEMVNLSNQMYGCRVVQKALEKILVDQQQELVSELEGSVVRCVKDQNGNHVIQKAIEKLPASSIGFIVNAFRGDVLCLSTHAYGCRVIQRCLERCEPGWKAMIMEELMTCIETLITDQFGNYVVQHVVKHDDGRGKKLVLDIVARGVEGYSKHKFASNVVETCLEKSDDVWRRQILITLANGHPQRAEGEGVFVSMIKDNYGNYVIQKLLDTLCLDDYVYFVDLLQPALTQAKRTGCGKQVLSIEKKMHRFSPYRGPVNGAYNPQPQMYRLPLPAFVKHPEPAGTPPPPPLTADNSLQSSALPSIDGDTVEGAAICGRKGSDENRAYYQ